MFQIPPRHIDRAGCESLPAPIARAGEQAAWRFIEFFTANIRNKNTRAAYARAVTQFFDWCSAHRVQQLDQIRPVLIAGYIEELSKHESGAHGQATPRRHPNAV